jgi:hypothetical protein
MNTRLAAAVVTALLTSCVTAPVYVYETADQVTAATTVQRDEYKKTTWITSPTINYSTGGDCYHLRTIISDGGPKWDQLFVDYTPSDWVFLENASDSQGRAFEVTVIDRDVSSGYGSYGPFLSEKVAVNLDREYLLDATENGLDIKVYGRLGSTVVKVPAFLVKGFMNRVALVTVTPK